MSYQARKNEVIRTNLFVNLDGQKDILAKKVTDWMSKATTLHADSITTEEKAEVVALRAAFIDALRAALGV